MPSLPPLAIATVVSQDGDSYGVNVILDGTMAGQMPSLPVSVGTHGPRDALRGQWPGLPTKGTRGLVVFPRGDVRNGIWICAVAGPFNDSSAHVPGAENIHYEARYSGYWNWQDEQGQEATVWPDGTQMLIGPAAVPTVTRHTVNAQQVRQATPFGQNERVPAAPGAFPLTLNHPTGAQASLTVSGAWRLLAANGQTATVEANGATIVIQADGKITATSPVEVDVLAPSIHLSNGGTLHTLLTDAAATLFNNHVHNGVQPGGGNSGPPTTTMGAGQETSIVRAE